MVEEILHLVVFGEAGEVACLDGEQILCLVVEQRIAHREVKRRRRDQNLLERASGVNVSIVGGEEIWRSLAISRRS